MFKIPLRIRRQSSQCARTDGSNRKAFPKRPKVSPILDTFSANERSNYRSTNSKYVDQLLEFEAETSSFHVKLHNRSPETYDLNVSEMLNSPLTFVPLFLATSCLPKRWVVRVTGFCEAFLPWVREAKPCHRKTQCDDEVGDTRAVT